MGWIAAFIGRILSTQNRFWLVDKMSNLVYWRHKEGMKWFDVANCKTSESIIY